MSTQIQFRRGTSAEHAAFTGAAGEVTVDTTKDVVVVHDGVTAGGIPAAKENHTHTGVYEPADVTILKDADIGVSVQAYDVDIPTIAASQVEMTTGTEAALRSMSPLRVAQAIAALGTAGGIVNKQTFTSTGANTWTKPGSLSADAMVLIELWGAGGSGAARATTGNVSGGPGGGYAAWLIKASLLSATETVTIGTGGTGVTGNTAGNPGGNTTFTVNGVAVFGAEGGTPTAGSTAAVGVASANTAGGGVLTPTNYRASSAFSTNTGGNGDYTTSANVPTKSTDSSTLAGAGGGASASTSGGDRTGGTCIALNTTGGTGGAYTGGNGTAGGTACGGGGAVNGGTSGAGGNGYAVITTLD